MNTNFTYPTPSTQPAGKCHWERINGTDCLIDEDNVCWQQFPHSPADTWAGSIQRHETMSDNWE